jgi:hypothetical protein
MSIGISPCPGCGTLLLDDTVECHRCHHVFDRERAEELAIQPLPTDKAVIEDLGSCHNCGEAVRSGLVRCWNCGVFLRADIQAAFDERQNDQRSPATPLDRNPQSRSMLKAEPHTPASLSEIDKNAQLAAYYAQRNGHGVEAGASPDISDQPLADATGADLSAEDDEDDFELSGDIFLTEATITSEPMPLAIPLVNETSGDTFALSEIPRMELESVNGSTMEELIETIPMMPLGGSGAETSPLEELIGTPEVSDASHPAEEMSEDDLLLHIALSEEKEEQELALKPRKKGFVTTCEAGCKVRVLDHHRGKVGKCPKCGAKLVVPLRKTTNAGAEEEIPLDPPINLEGVGKFVHIIQDVALHTIARGKLKLKAAAHAKDFSLIDLAIDPQALVLLEWPKGTLLKPTAKKIPEFRAALKSRLMAKKDETDLSPATITVVPTAAESIAIVQPTIAGGNESLQSTAVFGEGRIALELISAEEGAPQKFLSFSLSQFRTLAKAIREGTSWTNFAEGSGIPLQSEQSTLACHYLETPVFELQQLPYYQTDKDFTLEVSGYRCQSCGLVVSENGRKKEKIGDKTPASIKSAKCPKCQKPFGYGPLYTLKRGR